MKTPNLLELKCSRKFVIYLNFIEFSNCIHLLHAKFVFGKPHQFQENLIQVPNICDIDLIFSKVFEMIKSWNSTTLIFKYKQKDNMDQHTNTSTLL